MVLPKKQILGIHEQLARMREFPNFDARIEGASLIIEGEIQPTALSANYLVRVDYSAYFPPDVRVLDPALTCREGADKIPHMYMQESLCLYFPGCGEWSGDRPLGQYVIPWASLWLFYYELWHATGEWLGGGHETSRNEPIRREKIRP